jgi:effector-binding domain-containing protein
MAGPKLESRKATSIVYIEHMGPYDKVPWDEYMHRLYGWAKEQKVMPGFYPMSICYDDPANTPPEKCRSEVAISFKGKAEATSGLKIRQMPAMKVASISHKGPGSEFKSSYGKLNDFIAEKGYEISGPPMEVYSKKPEVVKGVTIIYAKIMMPVKKK